MKVCKRCNLETMEDNFYRNGRSYRLECKSCTDLQQAAGRFGLSSEQLKNMYRKQNGKCAICKERCLVYRNLSVDHDHSCCPTGGRSCGNCVRGLLCSSCNLGLGSFKDSKALLLFAVLYLM